MKHIKLFETFTPEDYYKQIDNISEEFDKSVDMSDRTIKKITNFNWKKSPNFELEVEWSRNNTEVSDFKYIMIRGIKRYPKVGPGSIISIVEREDEWFMVRMWDGKWWECDQLSGLQEFLIKRKALYNNV